MKHLSKWKIMPLQVKPGTGWKERHCSISSCCRGSASPRLSSATLYKMYICQNKFRMCTNYRFSCLLALALHACYMEHCQELPPFCSTTLPQPPVAVSLPMQGGHTRQAPGPRKPSSRDGQKALPLILTTGKRGLLSPFSAAYCGGRGKAIRRAAVKIYMFPSEVNAC